MEKIRYIKGSRRFLVDGGRLRLLVGGDRGRFLSTETARSPPTETEGRFLSTETKRTETTRQTGSGARLLSLTRPQAPLLGGAFATLSLTSSVTLSFPYLTGKIIDSSLSSPSSVDPTVAAAGLFSLICLAGCGVVARQILLTHAGENIVAGLRGELFGNILRQEAGFFDGSRTGDLVTRLTADVQIVQSALTQDVVNGARGVIMVAGGSSLLLVTSPTLTAISLFSLPPVFIFARHFGAEIKNLQRQVQEELGRTTTKVSLHTGEARRGEARRGSARLGCILARLGSARLGSAWLGFILPLANSFVRSSAPLISLRPRKSFPT